MSAADNNPSPIATLLKRADLIFTGGLFITVLLLILLANLYVLKVPSVRHNLIYAALLASLSGWLYAHLQRAVNPTPFGLEAGTEYLFMAVVGGVGHVWGALMGAGVVKILEDQLQVWLPRLLGMI